MDDRPLAESGRRAVASTAPYTALGEVELLTASTLVDVLDGVCWGNAGRGWRYPEPGTGRARCAVGDRVIAAVLVGVALGVLLIVVLWVVMRWDENH